MTTTQTLTTGGARVRAGYTFDPECHRATHRLRLAAGILRGMGIAPVYPEHSERCILNPKNQWNRCFGVSYNCECGVGTSPKPEWPEWVTPMTFNLAWDLANEVQTTRGDHNRAEAYAIHDRYHAGEGS